MQPRMVRAPNPSAMTLDGTRTYIVGLRCAVVIDAGPDEESHIDALASTLEGADSIDIVVTHRHADHGGAARALSRRTGGRTWAGDPSSATFLEGAEVAAEGVTFDTDDGQLSVLTTPGHTPDHIALVWDRTGAGRAVFVGDLLLGEGDTALVAAPEGNVADYLTSLERLEGLGAETFYPAHGAPITDPAVALSRFRDHRMRRVEQVRAMLRDHPDATTPVIVDRIYGAMLPGKLLEAARGSVEAIRIYLSSLGA
jgi:glyoxylase-like metal-dependent hydrolase (beta-lactamase superfamily II)